MNSDLTPTLNQKLDGCDSRAKITGAVRWGRLYGKYTISEENKIDEEEIIEKK